MKLFSNIPFFRILIPFVAGIIFGMSYSSLSFHGLILLAFLLFTFILGFYFKKQNLTKYLFFVCADVFLFMYGVNLVSEKKVSSKPLHYANFVNVEKETNVLAVISDLPAEKAKTIKCYLNVLQIKSDTSYKNAEGTIIAYIRKSPNDTLLQAGKTILFKTNLQEIPEPKNPFEFDYKTYLYNRQIYHTAFVDSNAFMVLPVEHKLNSVWETGLKCKHYILQSLKNSALTDRAYAICAALLTGYDDEIDREVMDAFAHSGTLHVLSVSGLHTGLIYLMLGFLFDVFDRKKKYKLSKFIFITLTLWFFALITGFSAPVLRAVIMFNLLGLGKIYFRSNVSNQLNILLVSAFMLLCYNPFFIADVGFQLSYFAMFGLIYFQPKFSNLFQTENRLVDNIWQSVTASVAATVSTLPITLFYFKQFPIWFFVCNLIVVPATFIVLMLALFVVLKLNFFAVLINYLIACLVWFISLFNSKQFGFIDNIDFRFSDLVFLSLLTVIFSLALQYRNHRRLAWAMLLLISWQFVSMLNSYTSKNESLFALYHINKKHAVFLKNKTQANLSKVENQDYNFHIRPHLINLNVGDISHKEFNYLQTPNFSLLILNKPNFLPRMNFGNINTLVLANNFKLQHKDLTSFKKLKTIVSDGSTNNFINKKTEELSRKFGCVFYSTKAKGAYLEEL
ncbi:MAG: ComEC/Rec2 family competence protein [Bacteroidetes bacterium]|nr:ComEC/Rec2 family competence protein [Bacteroidota bacterium]